MYHESLSNVNPSMPRPFKWWLVCNFDFTLLKHFSEVKKQFPLPKKEEEDINKL